MLKNLLFEIGCEEMPARFMPGFLLDLKQKAELKLQTASLSFDKIETYGTYRRLVLYVENLSPRQPDVSQEVTGPPTEIAYKNGAPTGAAFGFAKKQGVDVNDLKLKDANGKQYVYAQVDRKGEPTEKILPALLPEIITSLYMPLAMRWADLDFKFIRPIHQILAVYGNRAVVFELVGIKSRKTLIETADLKDYKKKLAKLRVIVDQDERREKIIEEAKKIDPQVMIDKALLEEINFLVENPSALKGKFQPAFLKLPSEVLITTMKKNQKYFPILRDGKLEPSFIVITDGTEKKYHAQVAEGNERVISARLSDAKFFFDEDLKRPLKARVADLKKVEYFKGLGTLLEKTGRVKALAQYIAKHLKIEDQRVGQVTRAAELCKADLTTQMVFEFPELQGTMGREYALASNENVEVAIAIFEHYLPRFAEDQLPKTQIGAILALSDKIDSIVGCFSIGKIPSGSEDPFGLRRAAYGIIKIILGKKFDLLLDEIIEASYKLYQKEPKEAGQILEFLAQRLKPILTEAQVRYDVIDAVLAGFNDAIDAYRKAQAITKALKEEWFTGLVMTADRVGRIAGKNQREEVKEHDLQEAQEKALFTLHTTINWNSQELIDKGDFAGALKELAKLTQPIQAFFEDILVMHEDERIRANRLALLKAIQNTFLNFADFGKIVLEKAK